MEIFSSDWEPPSKKDGLSGHWEPLWKVTLGVIHNHRAKSTQNFILERFETMIVEAVGNPPHRFI